MVRKLPEASWNLLELSVEKNQSQDSVLKVPGEYLNATYTGSLVGLSGVGSKRILVQLMYWTGLAAPNNSGFVTSIIGY